jgi:hypothetical protein
MQTKIPSTVSVVGIAATLLFHAQSSQLYFLYEPMMVRCVFARRAPPKVLDFIVCRVAVKMKPLLLPRRTRTTKSSQN